jgi:hypothetical protein
MAGLATYGLSPAGVGYRGLVIGDVELRLLSPHNFGEEGSRAAGARLPRWVLGNSGMWLFWVGVRGAQGLGRYMSLTPAGMLRWKPAPGRARIGSNVEGLFVFFFPQGAYFFLTAPAPAETSQAIPGFLNLVAHLLRIITRLASPRLASPLLQLRDPAPRHSQTLPFDNRVSKPEQGELILQLLSLRLGPGSCRISRG